MSCEVISLEKLVVGQLAGGGAEVISDCKCDVALCRSPQHARCLVMTRKDR